MVLHRSPTCSRGVIISFNFLFWVTGSAAILFGMWVVLDDSKPHLLNLLTTKEQAHFIIVCLSYTLFLVGCGMLSLVFLGCCTLLSKPSFIIAYLSIVVVLECVELVAILVTLSFRSSLLVGLQVRLSGQLVTDYGHQQNDNINTHGNNVFTQSLDYTQYMFNCCGVDGPHEYNHSRWFNFSRSSKEPRNVPLTCCVRIDPEESSGGSPISVVSRVFHGTVEEDWQHPHVQRETTCQQNVPGARYTQGCGRHIEEWFLCQSMWFMIVLLVPMVLQLVCIVFFSILLRVVRQQKDQTPEVSRDSSAGG